MFARSRETGGPGGQSGASDSALQRLVEDARHAVLARDALLPQLSSSLLVVSTYVTIYLFAARAVGVETSWTVLAPLVPPILLTMLIPVSVAGWGIREGASAVLWGAVGLTPEDGVAISVSYGLLVLVASLPGAAAPMIGRSGEDGPPTEVEIEEDVLSE